MREHLNEIAPRRMAVLDPIKLVIENYPEDKEELMDVPNHPQKPEWGKRQVPFSRELWIERDDYTDAPAKGYFRLAPGAMVRLRYGYVVKCEGYAQRHRPLHLPPRNPLRHARRGRGQGEGKHSLGEREARACGAGASV